MSESKSYVNPIHQRGIKIVEHNKNKRVSDIFNLMNVEVYHKSNIGTINKNKMIEVCEKRIGEKLRSVSPIINGHRNEDFKPINQNVSMNFGIDYDRIKRSEILNEFKKKSKINLNKSKNDNTLKKIKFLNFSPDKNENKIISSIPSKEKIKRSSSFIQIRPKKIQCDLTTSDWELHREEITKSATLSLIKSRNKDSEYLYNKFQDEVNILHDTIKRERDYGKQRVKERFTRNQRLLDKRIMSEQRFEIVDYYEMNQKIIDENFKNNSQINTHQAFNDLKKISEKTSIENNLNRVVKFNQIEKDIEEKIKTAIKIEEISKEYKKIVSRSHSLNKNMSNITTRDSRIITKFQSPIKK